MHFLLGGLLYKNEEGVKDLVKIITWKYTKFHDYDHDQVRVRKKVLQ